MRFEEFGKIFTFRLPDYVRSFRVISHPREESLSVESGGETFCPTFIEAAQDKIEIPDERLKVLE